MNRSIICVLALHCSVSPLVACESLQPKEVVGLVEQLAVEEGIDPALAEAVAWVESRLGQHMTSDAGAAGVMQLMPATAAELGVTDRCDSMQNIRAGIRYLKQLATEFDDPVLMLAAYNAGKGRVYQAEGIPEFRETADYIVKVLNRWKLGAKVRRLKSARLPSRKSSSSKTEEWRESHVIEIK